MSGEPVLAPEEKPNAAVREALATAAEAPADRVMEATMYSLRSQLNRIAYRTAELCGLDFREWILAGLPADLDFDRLGVEPPTYFDRVPADLADDLRPAWAALAADHLEVWEAANAFREVTADVVLELTVEDLQPPPEIRS